MKTEENYKSTLLQSRSNETKHHIFVILLVNRFDLVNNGIKKYL
jgi:hypothetical protein